MKRIFLFFITLLLCSCSTISNTGNVDIPLVTPTIVATTYPLSFQTVLDGVPILNVYFDEYKWDTSTQHLEDFPPGHYYRIAVDTQGIVWAQSNEKNILKIAGDTWQLIPLPAISGRLTSLSLGLDNQVWIGYDSGEIIVNDGVTWFVIEEPDDMFESVYALAATDNGIYVGTEQGIFSYGDGKWTSYGYMDNGLQDIAIMDLVVTPKQHVWARSNNSIYYFNGESWITFPLSNFLSHAPTGEIFRALSSSSADESAWVIITGVGLLHVFPDGFWEITSHPVELLGQGDFGIMNIYNSHSGDLWFGNFASAELGALYCLSGGEWSTLDSKSFLVVAVFDIDEAPDRSLWFATTSGLFHYTDTVCMR